MPPLLLDDEEAIAVAAALRTAAASGVAEIGEHATRAASNYASTVSLREHPQGPDSLRANFPDPIWPPS